MAHLRLLGRVLGEGIFWSWNLSFACLVLFGLGPVVLVDLVRAVWIGVLPTEFAIMGLAIVATPVVGMAVGVGLRGDTGRRLSLFFGVQVPVFTVLCVRLFAFRQMTTASTLFVGAFVVGAAALCVTVLRGPEARTRAGQVALLVGQTVFATYGMWLAVVLGVVFAMPVALWGLVRLPTMLWSVGDPVELIVLWFFLGTLAGLAMFPVAMVGVSVRSWSLVAGRARRRFTSAGVLVTSLGTVAALVLALGHTIREPHHDAFALLEGDRLTALAHEDTIRDGLLEAYLVRERYLATSDDIVGYAELLWDDVFFEGAGVVGGALARVAYAPLTYVPYTDDGQSEPERAAAAYRAFFDVPITRAERDTILEAKRHHWDWTEVAASVLSVGEERILLAKQDVRVVERGTHASVHIHDVYRNATWDQEEVVLYFNLPETAVVTGLSLGTTPDRSEAFHHVVAPRGAAQQVYREQVRRRIDPALLEQVGPRQYRLRAFPIEPRTGSARDLSLLTEVGPAMHLWLDLDVLAAPTADGWVWPLPEAAEVRNLFWDERTERTVNGSEVAAETWMPTRGLPAPSPRRALDVTLDGWRVSLSPGAEPARVPVGVAVVVDTTRSMAATAEELAAALARVEPSVVLCAGPSTLVPCPDFDPARHPYYGAASLIEILGAAEGRADVAAAPALLVLTGRDTYDQAEDRQRPLDLPPLYLAHMDGLPLAYADMVLDALTADGGVATADLAFPAKGAAAGWSIDARPADVVGVHTSADALAARAVIQARAGWADPGSVADLDSLHHLAVTHDVVSPYSSMIVLVNQAQRDRLKELSEAGDRFSREAESVASEEGGDFAVTATPEPEVWALLVGTVGLLAVGRRRRR